MIILYVKPQSEKVAIFISICRLIMRTNVGQSYCIFNNEVVFSKRQKSVV